MKLKGVVFMCALAIFVMAFTASAFAATSSGTATVTAQVSAGIAITVPSTVTVPVVAPGSTITTSFGILIKTNSTTWSLTVAKNQDLTNGAYAIPTGRFKFQTSTDSTETGSGGYQSFPGTVATGLRATGEAGYTSGITYQLQTNYDDNAGNYIAAHTYTATAP